ncbi:zinc finger protein aebp2-like protein [Leptotrombidium deliense]|uniref:Zinc finger protein aebp2-like protein n=1 Tax=Leptotrombidium deliense TaxID=299467 RepID=A0A443SRC5_9ACAR|nr:zinc finger protein aebp2-like protein [Leptotrombidium deliense]
MSVVIVHNCHHFSNVLAVNKPMLESDDSKANDDSTSQSSPASATNTATSSIVCKWTNCDWPGSDDDLVDHIREIHVELQPYHNHQHIFANSSCSTKRTRTAFVSIAAISSTDEPQTTNGVGASESCESSSSSSSMSSRNSLTSNVQQQYVCLWEGCKVYGKRSLSRSWLERHVLQHSGPRPFKCIVERCGARFKARSALERHVNAHFNGLLTETVSKDVPCVADEPSNDMFNIHESGPMMMRCNGLTFNNCTNGTVNGNSNSTHGTPNKLLKRKKVNKVKRRFVNLKSNEDYFDVRIMEHLKYSLYQLNATTGVDIVGSQRDIVFHSRVIARRRENRTGSFYALLHYEPEDM